MKPRRTYSVKRRRLLVYFAAFFLIVLLLVYVGMRMVILSLEDQVRDIRAERETLERTIEQLELKVAELRKGSRIKAIARERFGMIENEGAPLILY